MMEPMCKDCWESDCCGECDGWLYRKPAYQISCVVIIVGLIIWGVFGA